MDAALQFTEQVSRCY